MSTYSIIKKIRKNGREISRGGKILVMKVTLPTIIYGFLYNWYAVTDVRGFANTDNEAWEVPDNDDFNGLITHLGDNPDFTNKIKSSREEPDPPPRWNTGFAGIDSVNFALQGSGRRIADFAALGDEVRVWGVTEFDATQSYGLFTEDRIILDYGSKYVGGCIRLVRTATATEIAEKTDGDYCDDYIGNNGINYKTVFINGQVWTAENSIETKYNNGDPIPEVTVNAQWADLTTGARCSYDNNVNNAFTTT